MLNSLIQIISIYGPNFTRESTSESVSTNDGETTISSYKPQVKRVNESTLFFPRQRTSILFDFCEKNKG